MFKLPAKLKKYNMDNTLKNAVLDFLNNPHTHGSLADAASSLPEKYYNVYPGGLPYSFWGMLEHIRISQWDMIDFMVNPDYKEMEWPREYWPKEGEQADKKMWTESLEKYRQDEERLKKIIEEGKIDLLAKIPHGTGQTGFREILQVIDHNSYHIGQFIVMRRMIGEWKS